MFLGLTIFILGLIVGSAINSFLWRYETGKTYKGRSLCPNCNHQLSWKDNIPLISWVLLSAKCRYCKKPISIQYPLVEMATGLFFLSVFLFSPTGKYVNHVFNAMNRLGTTFALKYFYVGMTELLFLLAITAILIIIAIHDYRKKEIPNGFNLTLIILSTLHLVFASLRASYFIPKTSVLAMGPYLISAISAFLFFYAFVFFSKETWMGGGDAKMAFGMGLLLGPAGTFLAILIASVTGSIYGITGIILVNKSKWHSTKKKSRHEIPFGPFLAFGTYVAMVFGPQLIEWYVKIILAI